MKRSGPVVLGLRSEIIIPRKCESIDLVALERARRIEELRGIQARVFRNLLAALWVATLAGTILWWLK